MKNYIKMELSAIGKNESFARSTVAAFALPLNPSLSELSDIKTAVSEAVTNCIVHAYAAAPCEKNRIVIECETEPAALKNNQDERGMYGMNGEIAMASTANETGEIDETTETGETVASEEAVGGVLHIRVTDFGCGIDDVGRAIQPFYTTKEDEERSGMGFTIMQTFMDGFKVVSEKGVGTTVFMSKKIGLKDGVDA